MHFIIALIGILRTREGVQNAFYSLGIEQIAESTEGGTAVYQAAAFSVVTFLCMYNDR